MYNKNNNGPRTEPWGTPCNISLISDLDPETDVNWDLPDKYDLNQLLAIPRIP